MARVAYQIDEHSGEWGYVPCRATENAVLAYWKRQDKQHDTPPAEYRVVERYPLEHGQLLWVDMRTGSEVVTCWLLFCEAEDEDLAQKEADHHITGE